MTLHSGNSKEVISKNIKKLMVEKYPRKQAIAIALDNARKTKNYGEHEKEVDNSTHEKAEEAAKALGYVDKKWTISRL